MTFDKDFDENQSFDMPNDEVESEDSFDNYEEVDKTDSTGNNPLDSQPMEDDNVETIYYAVLLAIAGLFGYVVYKIYGYLTPVDEREIMAVVETKEEAPAPIAPPVAPIARIEEPQPRTITKTIVQSAGLSSDDKDAISKIASSVSEQKNAINDLSRDNEFMLREYNKMQRDIDHVNKKLDTIINKLHEMTKQKEAPKSVAPPTAPKKLYVLHVRAMVDGRAWLIDDKGATATVVVGHKLKDYGTVEKILVNQGVVTTSSGRTINFKKAK